jgi:WD40 repeat protein
VVELFTSFGYECVLPGLGEYSTAEHVRLALSHWSRDIGLGEQDVVVFYFAGHGLVEERDRHYLLCWDSRVDDLAATALPSEDVVRILTRTGLRNLLVILDTCFGGTGTADATRVVLQAVARRLSSQTVATGMWFVSSARAKDEAKDGAFIDALLLAIEEVTGRTGQRQQYLDLAELVHGINRVFDARGVRQRAEFAVGLSTGLPPFLPNRGYREDLPPIGTDLELQHRVAQRDLYEHFGPRSRGVEFESEQGLYFSGRDRVLSELVSWLTASTGDGKGRVVTGSPGCGKSAVLGRIVALSDPVYRKRISLTDADPRTVVPEGYVDVAVHVRHKRFEQVIQHIAEALGVEAEGAADLLQELSRRTRQGPPVVIVVDALDEAGSGTAADAGGRGEPRRIARELLRPLSEIPGVRLLVGARLPLVSSLGPTFTALNLDEPEYLGDEDVAGYVRKVLLAADEPDVPTPYRDWPELAHTVAVAVAERAGRVFLVARMTARSLRSAPQPMDITQPGWADELPSEIGEAFDDYLNRFGAQEERVRNLLAPLAFAEGQGLPRGVLWTRITATLSESPCTDGDIAWLLERASEYVAEVPDDQGRSVYRLYHQALAECLRGDPRFPPQATQHRIVDALLSTLAPVEDGANRDWFGAHPYIRAHLATHAAAAGRLDELVADPGFLLGSSPLTLLGAFPAVSSQSARQVRNAYEQVTHRLVASVPLGERAAYLQLSAQRCGARRLAQRIDGLGVSLPWSTRWAWWSPTGVHRHLSGHEGGVNAVAVGDLDGRPIAVTGSADTTARIWDLITNQQIGQPLIGHEGDVDAVAIGELDEYSVVLTAGADGSVRVWDLSTGQEFGSPLRGHTNGVTSVALGRLEGCPIAVTGSSDGTARVWDLVAREQIGQPLTGHRSGIRAVALGTLEGRLVVLTGGEDSRTRVWDLATQRPLGAPLIGHTQAVTAIALGHLGSRMVVVTGSQDGTVGLWDLATRQQIGEPLAAQYLGVSAVALEELEGQPIILTGGRYDARIWNLATRQQIDQPLTGHTGQVVAVALGFVNRRPIAVTAGTDRTARIWDLTADNPLAGHTQPVSAMAASEIDGHSVAITGSNDTTARLWDLGERRQIGRPLDGHTGPVTAVALGKLDGRPIAVTGSTDTTVRLWDLSTSQPIGRPLEGHTNHIGAVVLSRLDGRTVVLSGSHDGTIRIWDAESFSQIGEPLTGHNDDVALLTLGECDGRSVIVVASEWGSARMWDFPWQGQPSTPPMKYRKGLGAKAVGCVDGRPVVLLVGGDNAARLWDLATRQSAGEPLIGHTAHITAAVLGALHGCPVALTTSFDGSARVWDLRTSQPVGSPLSGHSLTGFEGSVALGVADGVPIAITADGKGVRTWDLTTFQQVGEPLSGGTAGVGGIAIGQLEERFVAVTGSDDGALRILDLATGERVAPHLTGHRMPITGLALGEAEGHILAVTGGDQTVRVWDLARQRPIGDPLAVPMGLFFGRPIAVAVGRVDGRLVSVWSSEVTAHVWDVVARRPLGEPLAGHTAWIRAVTVGEVDGRAVAVTGSEDGTARLWDLRTGAPVGQPMVGHDGDVRAVALGTINGNRTVIVTGDGEGAVRLWNARTQEPIDHPIARHDRVVTAIIVGDVYGRAVAVIGDIGGTVRLWDLACGKLFAQLELGADVSDLALGPDGALCVATSMGVVAFRLRD